MNTTLLQLRSDEQLIQDYLSGGINSIGILYNRYYPKVYHKCLSFTKNADDAFDFTQDVLLKAFSKIVSFKGEAKFSTWLYSITHNYCISQFDRKKKITYNNFESVFDNVCDGIDSEELNTRKLREDKELDLNQYLDQIPETDKKMLELKYRYNYSIQDLQNEFSISASAVKMRLLRARQKIEQLYNNNYAA
jgi:RNA polymerase sigma-70 factor (ECF subfamily)